MQEPTQISLTADDVLQQLSLLKVPMLSKMYYGCSTGWLPKKKIIKASKGSGYTYK